MELKNSSIFLDIQVNGGSGLLFNDINTIDEFLKIELNYLKYGKSFIIPTFITDSDEKLQKFIDIVLQRIALNNKKYVINGNTVILPKLFGVHFEGPFITNKGTHPEKYLKKLNKENLSNFIQIIKPLQDINIYFTFAPELLEDIKLLDLLKNNFKNITISAGHTKITEKDFKELQDKLGQNKIKMLTHFHNAMLGGHFVSGVCGIPNYVINNGFSGYFGMIADGQHTNKGELLPMLLNYSDNICIVSDGASPSCCKIDEDNNLFTMGGNIAVVEQKEGQLPCFFWTDFSKNRDFCEKDVNKIYEMYISGKGGYKTLAGSAIHLLQSFEFLQNINIEEELEKIKQNQVMQDLFERGLRDNSLKIENIQDFINKNLYKMFVKNPVKALNINKEFFEYEFVGGVLWKNGEKYVDFGCDFGEFLGVVGGNWEELKEGLINKLTMLIG